MVDAPDLNPDPSIGFQLLEGFTSGLVGAIATGAGAVGGHVLGTRFYPQQYEGVPSTLFFFPLALVIGFFVGGSARLAKTQWNTRHLFGTAAVSALAGAIATASARRPSAPRSPMRHRRE